MKTAWQKFTSAISEGFAGVGVAAQKMKVYLDWAKSGNPFSYKYQQAKIADIDAQAAKEKAARKNQDDQAMAGIFNETSARIQGTVAATQAELDAQRARQRFGKRMRENLLAGEMAALDASTNEALDAAEANLANAQGELAASVAAARSKAAAAAGDNTRGAGLPEMPAPGDLAAAAAGAGSEGQRRRQLFRPGPGRDGQPQRRGPDRQGHRGVRRPLAQDRQGPEGQPLRLHRRRFPRFLTPAP